jgi:hypothetical protein
MGKSVVSSWFSLKCLPLSTCLPCTESTFSPDISIDVLSDIPFLRPTSPKIPQQKSQTSHSWGQNHQNSHNPDIPDIPGTYFVYMLSTTVVPLLRVICSDATERRESLSDASFRPWPWENPNGHRWNSNGKPGKSEENYGTYMRHFCDLSWSYSPQIYSYIMLYNVV